MTKRYNIGYTFYIADVIFFLKGIEMEKMIKEIRLQLQNGQGKRNLEPVRFFLKK